MINRILLLFKNGLKQLQLNAHYLLAAFLVIVLPIIFIWIAQSFFSAAYESISTNEKQSISQLHDSVVVLLQTNNQSIVQEYLEQFVESNNSITKAKVLVDDNGELVVVASSIGEQIGTVESSRQAFDLSNAAEGDSLIFDLTVNDTRTWQAIRPVLINGESHYVFTEHSFAQIDSVMAARQQQVYLFLPLVFLFLLSLAMWLVKQTQWQKLYVGTKQKLEEQMLFTNTLAHELRAPLTAIRGYVSFLQESNRLSDDEERYVSNIRLSAERLLALINDFLEVARIQSGKLKISFLETDVRKVIQAVDAEFSALAEEKGLDLHTKVPNKPVLANTDAERLQQVVTNLVSNALKYTEKGSVAIELTQTKLKTIITIKDTGNGISGEDQKRLFQAFTRVGKADKTGATGTGLGMWITKQLVELLHGTVTLESIEGVGTHMKLTFDV